MDTTIIQLIESGKLIDAQEALNESLAGKALELLVEKKKQVVAKSFKKPKSTGKDEKAIQKASLRKAAKEKLGKLKKVK
jgi:hypothetical protein